MEIVNKFIGFFESNNVQLIISLILIFLFFIIRKLTHRLVNKQILINRFTRSREVYIRKLITAGLLLFLAILLGMVWEVSIKGLSLYFASIFAVIGVALFASWSILSNLTASLLLFFFFPYKIGSDVKIMDGDNSVEGKISDITLFYVEITSKAGQTISYPNNLAIQKPIILL